MKALNNLRIKWKRAIMVGAQMIAGVTFAVVTFSTLQTVEINGPLYREISVNRTLLADINPPSVNLAPTRLLVYRAMEEPDRHKREELFAQIRQAQKQFADAYQQHMKDFPEGKLKAGLSGALHQTAEEYFSLLEQAMIPAIRQGDPKRVNEARLQLVSIGGRHQQAADELLRICNEENAP